MIVIRRYKRSDARQVAALISTTYARFNRGEGTPTADRRYIRHYAPRRRTRAELHRLFRRTNTRFVATRGARVVGVLRARENHLVNLFVAGAFHRRGIATRLHDRFEKVSRRAGYAFVTVRSSLFAVPFYRSAGYTKTTGVRSLHGNRVQPMRKRLP